MTNPTVGEALLWASDVCEANGYTFLAELLQHTAKREKTYSSDIEKWWRLVSDSDCQGLSREAQMRLAAALSSLAGEIRSVLKVINSVDPSIPGWETRTQENQRNLLLESFRRMERQLWGMGEGEWKK